MTRSFAATLLFSSLVACVAQRPIVDDQPCPCAPGWSCDKSRNVCVANAGSVGTGGTGSGGNSGTGGATPCDGGATIICTDGSMACSLAACPTTGTAGTSGGAGRGGTSGTGGRGGTQPDSCAATCTTPPGTVLTPSRVEEAYAVLEGRWELCTGAWGFGAPSDVIGLEFGPGSSDPNAYGSTVGGDFYYLVSGPSGPERGRGFAYQLKYDVSASGSSVQLNIHSAPNSGFGGSMRYSVCPREVELNFDVDAGILLVPIGGGSGGGSGTGGNGGSGGGGGGSGAGGGGGTQADSCAATCTTPPGTAVIPSRVEETYAVLEGRWGLCAGPWGFGAPSDVIGVEFGPASTEPTPWGSTVGGDLYYLVSGPSGPERGSGFAYQLKYDVGPSGSSVQLSIHPTPNSGFGGTLRYSACPREIDLRLMYQDTGTLLVPIGDGSGFGTGKGGTGGTGGTGGIGGKGGTGGSAGASGASGTSGGWPTDGGMSYPLSFVCTSDAGSSCPAGQACPEVPRSATSCGDIPGVLGHPPIPQTSARPVGCMARLPFGNPYYLDMQVQCVCMTIAGTSSWQCAL
jgi:hypothetical protein